MSDKKQQEQLHNTIGLYVHLKMALNHMACIDIDDLPNNYVKNKMRDLKISAEKLMKPIEINLGDGLDMVEETIINIHDRIEDIL
jgi:hypothetical protein